MSRIYPCVYCTDDLHCTKYTDDNCKSWCVLGPCQDETPSNADRIRAMSDEELAEFFPATASEFSCPPNSTNESCRNAGGWFNGCPKCWLDWLRQEVNDGKEEKEENQPAK